MFSFSNKLNKRCESHITSKDYVNVINLYIHVNVINLLV